MDSIVLSQQIANSLKQIAGEKYSTVAFSRILGSLDKEIINELIDYTNVAIVKSRGFRVIDRSKLQLILTEQKFNISGMVSTDTYKELGKLLGVDLFLYGNFYKDILVLKAIDVEKSSIIWADVFEISELSKQTIAIADLAQKMISSLKSDQKRLKSSKINQISFWNIKTSFDDNLVLDYLSASITKDGTFQIIDRNNLKLILEEQKLNMEEFINEEKAKKMGELYGIDAFIYGSITPKSNYYVGSFKLLNIYNGVIEWADLIKFNESQASNDNNKQNPRTVGGEMVLIPAGMTIIGSDNDQELASPQFKTFIKAFYIDRTEVSNLEYYEFVKQYKHRAPPSWPDGKVDSEIRDKPVVMVNWNDAERFCKSRNKRLPKEIEWERAFRGDNANMFPWQGSKFRADYVNTVESRRLKANDVETAMNDVSQYGVINLAGNVREWVDDFLLAYPGAKYYSNKIRREKVLRGASWAQPKESATGWFRDSSKPNYAWKDVGFRCAKSAR